jgi:recombination protein RecA
VKKNKVAPPFTESEFDIMYNEGISRTGDILDLGVQYGQIEKRGSYFRVDDELIGQGRENAKEYLAQNPALLSDLENKIRQHVGLPALAVSDEA